MKIGVFLNVLPESEDFEQDYDASSKAGFQERRNDDRIKVCLSMRLSDDTFA